MGQEYLKKVRAVPAGLHSKNNETFFLKLNQLLLKIPVTSERMVILIIYDGNSKKKFESFGMGIH